MAYGGSRGESIGRALLGLRELHAGLAEAKFGEGYYAKPDTRFKPQEPLVDVQAVTELSASFGPIAINRAYCNWQFYGRYRMLCFKAQLSSSSVPAGRVRVRTVRISSSASMRRRTSAASGMSARSSSSVAIATSCPWRRRSRLLARS